MITTMIIQMPGYFNQCQGHNSNHHKLTVHIREELREKSGVDLELQNRKDRVYFRKASPVQDC